MQSQGTDISTPDNRRWDMHLKPWVFAARGRTTIIWVAGKAAPRNSMRRGFRIFHFSYCSIRLYIGTKSMDIVIMDYGSCCGGAFEEKHRYDWVKYCTVLVSKSRELISTPSDLLEYQARQNVSVGLGCSCGQLFKAETNQDSDVCGRLIISKLIMGLFPWIR